MKWQSKLTALLLTVMLLCSTLILSTSAADFDGLEISIDTSKSTYRADDSIRAKVVVKNTNKEDVTNIRLEHQVPEGYEVADEAKLSQKAESLKPNEEITAEVSYIPIHTGNTWIKILIFAILGVVLIGVAALVIVIVCVRKKKAKPLMALLLCAGLMSTMMPFQALAAEQNVLMFTHNVTVKGEPFALQAKIMYDEIKGEKKNITIDDTGMLYDIQTGIYHIVQPMGKLMGTLRNSKNVKRAICEVMGENGITLFKKEFAAATTWAVDEMKMIVGMNTVKITVEYTDGTHNESTLQVNNACAENMNGLNVDKNDDDQDGVLNFTEEAHKTDPKKPDTDEDGLTDYYELAVFGTDPLALDTDKNGTADGYEDADGDTLKNIDEIETYQTDPINQDTDSDGLSDASELQDYHTDPVNSDTDGDGRTDGWELANDYDPLVPNADFPPEADEETPDVTVDSDGYVEIRPVEDDEFLNANTPGYVGSDPFHVELENGKNAQVTVGYDPSATTELPTLYYFNETTQCYEPVPTTPSGDGKATATVNKSGVYILLNHRYVDAVWNDDIFRPSEDAGDGTIDMVFVIDRSASMDSNDPKGIRKTLTKEFIEKLRDIDRAAIVQFTAIGETIQPMTNDKTALINAVDGIVNSDGGGCAGSDANAGTNGSAGIRQAITQLDSSTAKYKYIIFLTDGEDTTVSEDYGDENGTTGLTGEAKRKGIVIHTVGLVGSGGVDIDLLKRVAKGTGGNYYLATVGEEAENDSELVKIYDEIESITVDRKADSNNDRISDYYTRIICDGKLTTATGGTNLFGHATFEDVQKNADFDGDGLLNGEELQIVENEKGVYVKVNSFPYTADSDGDSLVDMYEKSAGVSAVKRNAFAEKSDIQWLTNDANFAADVYFDLYNESVWERGSVLIGNAFFGTTLDQTTLYQKALVDYFQAVDAEILNAIELKNYRELTGAYLDASFEDIKNNLISTYNSDDKDKFLKDVDTINEYCKKIFDILGITKNIGEVKKIDNIFLTLSNLSDTWGKGNCEYQLELLHKYMASLPSHVTNDTREGWLSYLSRMSAEEIEYRHKLEWHDANIQVRMAKYNKVVKGLDFLDKALKGLNYIQDGWTTYMDYCDMLAGMETIQQNAYVLDCVLAKSQNPYLRSAASKLKFYIDESYSSQTRELAMALDAVDDFAISIALDIMHGAIAKAGVPGLVIELTRTIGNVAFDIDEASQAAATTVALCETANTLAKNYQGHLDGGYAVDYDNRWISYTEYSNDMYVTLLNLAELRRQSEVQMGKWQKGYQDICKTNSDKCKGMIDKYNERYYTCYLR